MSLETSTFISGLTETWPVTGDTKSQGDDHLRLLKSVLKNTFPVGNRAFYFPTNEITSSSMVLDATDQNNFISIDTTAGNVAVTLPGALAAGDKGWSCEIIKYSGDANAVIVSAASGLITSRVGATATIRVGVLVEPARFIWSGGAWWCTKPGALIGSTASYDGAVVPPGYLLNDGAAYNTTNFAELFAVLASGVVRDKRGRTEIGTGTGAGLTNRVLGALVGEETHLPTLAEMFPHSHGGVTAGMNANTVHSHTYNEGQLVSSGGGPGGSTVNIVASNTSAVNLDHLHAIASQGSGTAFNVMQPSIAAQKIIRAC